MVKLETRWRRRVSEKGAVYSRFFVFKRSFRRAAGILGSFHRSVARLKIVNRRSGERVKFCGAFVIPSRYSDINIKNNALNLGAVFERKNDRVAKRAFCRLSVWNEQNANKTR